MNYADTQSRRGADLEIPLPIAAHGTVVDTGLHPVGAAGEIATFAEVPEGTRARTRAALRAHLYCLLSTRIVEIPVNTRS